MIGDSLFRKIHCDRTRWHSFKLEERFRLDVKKYFLKNEASESLVAQRGGGCCVSGDNQGQAGQGSKQSYLAIVDPVHCREFD